MDNMKQKVVLAVCGGIAAYKTPDLVSGLRKAGFRVEVMQTPNSEHFVTPEALRVMADKYWTMDWGNPDHINVSAEMTSRDAFVVAPATANTIAKMAHGIADNIITDTILALPREVNAIICPAMNSRMYRNNFVQANIQSLRDDGWEVLEPATGELACRTEGEGKLPSTREIVNFIKKVIGDEEE